MTLKGITHALCTLVFAAALTACGTQLQKAEKVTPTGDQHATALYDGYLGLSRAEYDEGDYRDSDYFAQRAMQAGENQKFEPQIISARELPADKLNEMAIARRQIITALYRGAAEKLPQDSAAAQVGFDCWMQEQEENFQPDDIAACRENFDSAMLRINAAFAPAAPLPAKAEDRIVFDVFFDFDSAELTPKAKEHLTAIANTAKLYERPVVTVLGNADQVGAEDYNVALSQRRADAVAKELEANGIKPAGVFARGDQVPAVANPNRKPEELNRRALIVIRGTPSN